MAISQGDTIVHPQHGVGQIQSISKRSFMGQEPRSFAQLFFERDGLRLMMSPKDLDATVRRIISAREARRILKDLEACDARMSAQWKTRTSRNEATIQDGDPHELAKVYKGLSRMQAEGKSLRAADRKHLQTAFQFLTDELAAALDKPRGKVEQMIQDCCVFETEDA